MGLHYPLSFVFWNGTMCINMYHISFTTRELSCLYVKQFTQNQTRSMPNNF